MKVSTFVQFTVIMLVFFTLNSCKKDEGPGGTSTITGKVIVHDFDGAWQQLKKVYPAADEKVYVIYGSDGTIYDDDFDTSYDGTYEFKYLQKGVYKLFVYSKDTTGVSIGIPANPERDTTFFQTVEITANGSTVTVPDFIILDNNQ